MKIIKKYSLMPPKSGDNKIESDSYMKRFKYKDFFVFHFSKVSFHKQSDVQKTNICWGLCIFFFLFLWGCHQKPHQSTTSAVKEDIQQWIYQNPSTDSLILCYEKSSKETASPINLALIANELGKRYRKESNFSEAIKWHRISTKNGELSKDTIVWVQTLNNLATDFRRIGMLSTAAGYHYQAYYLSLNSAPFLESHEWNINKKNEVISLNGIGNIFLSMEDYDNAEKTFRKALKGEIELNSDIGKAINYANLGSIFEHRNELDSAEYYYRQSFLSNQKGKSKLGIGLCYTHLGDIQKKKKHFKEAEENYILAKQAMAEIKDIWHTFNATYAIASLFLEQNDVKKAKEYIDEAEHIANAIETPEHFIELYTLKKRYEIINENYKKAIEYDRLLSKWEDYVRDTKDYNRITEIRIKQTQEENIRKIEQLNTENVRQKEEKRNILIYYSIITILFLLLIIALFYINRINRKRSIQNRKIEKFRTEFFTNITHEFRTPLTIIIGQTELLIKKIEEISQTKNREMLMAIHRQGVYLLSLVNRILDNAKARSGLMQMEYERGNIVAYLSMIIESFHDYVIEKEKNIKFSTTSHELIMTFSPYYLKQVLNNLISNAIKYSEEKSEIRIGFYEISKKEIEIRVSDRGKGIASSDIPFIFEMFFQSYNFDKSMGTGIGLAFSKQLIEIMGGSISVSSTEGVGSTFILRLPTMPPKTKDTEIKIWTPADIKTYKDELSIDSEEEPMEDEAAAIEGQSDKKIILVVEDNKDVRFYIKNILMDQYCVVLAKDGVEGLSKAMDLVPDLIITDRMMPKKDGVELCRDLRSSSLLAHIPIIMLTAKVSKEDQLIGFKTGADLYIPKPFESEELLLRVKNILKLCENQQKAYSDIVQKFPTSLDVNLKDILPQKEPNEKEDYNLWFIMRVNDHIMAHIDEAQFGRQELADLMCLSVSQLNRKLNAIAGCSISVYIRRMRVDLGVKMLTTTEKDGLEIAVSCGFSDYQAFYRAVKQEKKVTPSYYRKEID